MNVISAVNKKAVSVILGMGLAVSAFAYNPPVQGENLGGFINPRQLTVGNSTAGGPLFTVSPSVIMVNPALYAYQNRVSIDLGYTGIFTADEASPYAQSFGTGIIVPTDWCNFGGEIYGVFSETEKMQLGDSINYKFAAAKEVAENFAIGAGVSGGWLWGTGNDWNLCFETGAVYKWGELGPMKNFRIGASILNIGKVYNNTYSMGIYGANSPDYNNWNSYPGFMTIRTGAAAEFVNSDNFTLGLSLDVTTPFFANFIIDCGVQMHIVKFIEITSSWQFDANACVAGRQSWMPTVGISFKFALDTSFTKKDNWTKSDIEVGTAWKNVRGNVNAVSAGTVINLGQPDRKAPVITVDFDVEEE